MSIELDPVIGQWYSHTDKGGQFEIVAVDEEARVVEIQYFDGDLDEVAMDDWYELEIESIEPPEDWTGPVDDVQRDDLGTTDDGMEASDWKRPLDPFNVDTEAEARLEETNEEREAGDDWGEGHPEEDQWEGEE